MITVEQLEQGLPIILVKHEQALIAASAIGGAIVVEAPDTAVNFASCSVRAMDVAELAALLGLRDIDFEGGIARYRQDDQHAIVLIAANRVKIVAVSDEDLRMFVEDLTAALCVLP